jgi:Predicted lipoprotein of unknown function (DUF2380)
LILVSALLMGPEIFTVIKHIIAFGQIASNAKNENDLDEAGEHLAIAVTKIGIDVVMAIILHKATKSAKPYFEKTPTTYAKAVTPDGQITRIPIEDIPGSDRLMMEGERGENIYGEGPEAEAITERSRSAAGLARPPRHHVFPREYRPWFEARGFKGVLDIDKFTVELDPAEHQAIHGGGNWRLGRTWRGEWNRMMMERLFEEQSKSDHRLNVEEITAIVKYYMVKYNINKPFVDYRGD